MVATGTTASGSPRWRKTLRDLISRFRPRSGRGAPEPVEPPTSEAEDRRAWRRRLLALVATVLSIILGAVLLDTNVAVQILKILAIFLLSFLPGLIYFTFLRTKAVAVWEEYVLNLYRLRIDRPEHLPPPPVDSFYWQEWWAKVSKQEKQEKQGTKGAADHVDAVCRRANENNIYLKKFRAAYGSELTDRALAGSRAGGGDPSVGDEGVVQPGSSPSKPEVSIDVVWVFVATVLFGLGWVVFLRPAPFAFVLRLDLPKTGLILPVDTLMFGFLGSYFFLVQLFIRRYFYADLKPQAYINAIQRMLVVAVLALVLDLLWEAGGFGGPQLDSYKYATAFLVGIFPQIGLRAVQVSVARVARWTAPVVKNDFPLSDLDGLNLWYEARLLEEGIEDMENLATADLVDLMLRTRIPLGRLLDWIDQAHLYIRVRGSRGPRRRQRSRRERLRILGIRTATDLQDAFKRVDLMAHADLLPKGYNDQFVDALTKLFCKPGEPSVAVGLLKSIDREVTLWHVRQWKDFVEKIERDRHRPGKQRGGRNGQAGDRPLSETQPGMAEWRTEPVATGPNGPPDDAGTAA